MKAILASATAFALLLSGCGGKDPDGSRSGPDRDLSLAPVDTSAALADVAPEQPEATPSPAPEPPRSRPTPPPARPAAPAPAPPTPSPSPAPSPPPVAAPAPRSLASGTTLTLAAVDSFTTQTHKVGQTVTARVPADVKDAEGRTVIPAGATVTLTITQLEVSENKNDPGKLELRATQVSFGGQSYRLAGLSTSVEHELKGRGVQAGDAAKVGAGAAAGAVVGRVLSGKKKGAVVGGVIGAAAGAAAAANTYDRDVVVAAGAKIVIRLSEALSIS